MNWRGCHVIRFVTSKNVDKKPFFVNQIGSKLSEFDETKPNFNESIECAMLASLSRLRLTCVDTILLHRPDQLLGCHGEKIFYALKNLKEKGLARRIGISIYSPDFLGEVPRKFKFDVVQIPLNVFDQRIISSLVWAIRR